VSLREDTSAHDQIVHTTLSEDSHTHRGGPLIVECEDVRKLLVECCCLKGLEHDVTPLGLIILERTPVEDVVGCDSTADTACDQGEGDAPTIDGHHMT